MTKSYAKKLAQEGFALIPCKENKAPVERGWSESPRKTPEQVEVLNSYYYGCRCGDNDIECLDVDLKVLTSLKERQDFWNDFLSFCRDNIEDFDKKVVKAKTKGKGYHVIYKTKVKQGNKKLARLKDNKEAIFETRGVGGQFILYNKFEGDNRYHDAQYLTDEERDIIITIAKSYNYEEPEKAETPKVKKHEKRNSTDITPWEDFNNKKSVLDVCGDEFKVVRNTSKSTIIKRHGAESPHSGYIYKDTGLMYLFSTGTQYPAEKPLNPFDVYAIKYHHSNYTEAASKLYKEGYGSRRLEKIEVPEIDKKELERINFPIEIYPKSIQHFIIESSKKLNLSTDYMGCAFLWVMSLVTGNAMVMEVKPGWIEVANLWMAVVGKPGIGKTPSLNQMVNPLRKLNIREQREYQKKKTAFDKYEKMSKEEKEQSEEIKEPKSGQFIVGDVTLEALVQMHEENPNAVGVFKDELAGWIKDMNKYRAGSDLEFWLSSWSGTSISLNRKTSRSAFVDKPFIPVLGGIQPTIFDEFANGENKENGFIDRVLITYPSLEVNDYNTNYIDQKALDWYDDFVVKMKNTIKNDILSFDENDEIYPLKVTFDSDSEKEWVRIFNKLTALQNSPDENEYMKSMLPKQKSYIPRFALLINNCWSFLDEDYNVAKIKKQSILNAEKLSAYFVNMAKLVKQDSFIKHELNKVSKKAETTFGKFEKMYNANPDLNKTVVAEMLDISRTCVYKWIKKIEKSKNKPKTRKNEFK